MSGGLTRIEFKISTNRDIYVLRSQMRNSAKTITVETGDFTSIISKRYYYVKDVVIPARCAAEKSVVNFAVKFGFKSYPAIKVSKPPPD